ncbi:MAG TPA: adenylate/guanylate cyclase domain-containing protein, partial [Phototrophicaceae bacterium]|nr:adenylate/guanylate cyclase domain-containing protein [Phototrophicaceae bacterium]
ERIHLGGQLQQITVMFADLQNFTTISEITAPQELLQILNAHHELIVGVIQDHGGTIDKFIGDAVMALYNTPLEQSDHVLRAVRTTLAIREALPAFHAQLAPEFRMKINIGLHTGLAVVGNVGASHLMNFTAVGDTVNVAARLQSHGHDGQIIISESVHEAVSKYVEARRIGPMALKGRTETITAYEIMNYQRDLVRA